MNRRNFLRAIAAVTVLPLLGEFAVAEPDVSAWNDSGIGMAESIRRMQQKTKETVYMPETVWVGPAVAKLLFENPELRMMFKGVNVVHIPDNPFPANPNEPLFGAASSSVINTFRDRLRVVSDEPGPLKPGEPLSMAFGPE